MSHEFKLNAFSGDPLLHQAVPATRHRRDARAVATELGVAATGSVVAGGAGATDVRPIWIGAIALARVVAVAGAAIGSGLTGCRRRRTAGCRCAGSIGLASS